MKHLFFLSFSILTVFAYSQDSKNMNLLSSWTSDSATKYNDIWGYTDSNDREYAIVGSNWGTHFIDVTIPNSPIEITSFKGNATDVTWRDFKVFDTYAFGVADGDSNSLQIFDLQYLPDSVIKVNDNVDLSSSCHNIFIENERLYLASNTSSNGKKALDIYSLTNPSTPTLYKAMDNFYFGGYALHDIFVKNNVAYCSAGYGGLYIYDLTDVDNPILLASITVYPDQGYNHSSWLSADNSTLVVADEVPDGLALKLFDVSDLDNIEFLSMFESNEDATPHNPFIIGDNIYISYYMEGVQVFNYSNIFNVEQVAFYDTYPDNGNNFEDFGPYAGCWGLYPFLPSNNLIASDIKYGLQILKSEGLNFSSIEKKEVEKIKLFPNPARSAINIHNIKNYSTVTIKNTLGEIVYRFENVSLNNNLKINIENLNSGIYFLTLKNKLNQVNKKLIIN